MDARRHRMTLLVLAASLVALIGAVVWFFPSGNEARLPAPLESVSPTPGDVVASQTEIVIELPPGYTAALVVDGRPVPSEEVVAVTATGTFRWRPGPGSVIGDWDPGEHTVEVSWDRSSGVPDPGAYAWTFRVI